jgi:glycine C-acetyltransferase
MPDALMRHLAATLREIEDQGLYKRERPIASPQGAHVTLGGPGAPRRIVNLCANNYLGLANEPQVIAAAKAALDAYGFGMASVRFICGTQTLHRKLEQAIARFLGKDDAILFAACFDANGGIFEPLLGEGDAIISDALNHASIIDGVRLCKAKRYRYANGDMDELADRLDEAARAGARFKMIATDGVFSMDGYVAKLGAICALAERHDALVLVDDCHATGFMGTSGRGTPEHTGVGDRVQVLTGTFGKALGGAMGGYVAAAQPVIDLLRQRSRPYLFSNSLAPAVAAGSLKALELAAQGTELRRRLFANSRRFRDAMTRAGFELLDGETPIVPVMLHDAKRAQALARALDERGVYVAGFFYPVVPHGRARIRTQMSAAHAPEDIDLAVDAFADAGRSLGIL